MVDIHSWEEFRTHRWNSKHRIDDLIIDLNDRIESLEEDIKETRKRMI